MTALLDRPLFLEPKAEYRVWGGRRLQVDLGRQLPDGPHGESWEIHGDLKVAEGPAAGRTLDSLVAEFGKALLGSRADVAEKTFPLLTKWLDCRDWLSVQVHPDDPLSRELTGDLAQRGKSEAWYVAQVEPDAQLIHGLADGTAASALLAADGKAMLPLLGYQTPPQGSLLYTGAGTVHALGPGFLIYEVQQSSDLTYRLYDWERDRPIHPAESKRCILESVSPPCQQSPLGLVCPYFEIKILNIPQTLTVDEESFTILAAVEGNWELSRVSDRHQLNYGQTVLLPASLGEVEIEGEGRILAARLGRVL